MPSIRLYYAQECRYGVGTLSDGDILEAFSDQQDRDYWVRCDPEYRQALTTEKALYLFGREAINEKLRQFRHTGQLLD